MQLVTKDYQGTVMSYQDDGWFNATVAAAKFGKLPAEWLRLPSTKEYMEALKRHGAFMGKTHRSKSGPAASGGGTWLHPKLAVRFAQWLDADFAVWCDSQIDDLLRGKSDWRKLRHEAAATYKVMSSMLQAIREDAGKETAGFHYANEAKLVNWALAGKFEPLNRETLPLDELDLLAHLEERNAVLIGRGLDYDKRKPMLHQYAFDWRMARAPLLA